MNDNFTVERIKFDDKKILDLSKHRERKINKLKKKHIKDLKASSLTEKTLEVCSYRSEEDSWVFDIEDPFTGEVQYTIRRFDNVAKGSPKYRQPKDTKPHPYYSRLIDWSEVTKDLTRDLIITEGAKKADSLNQNGYTAISIQGTYGWADKKQLVKSLLCFLKPGRRVYICFDSDQLENQQVANAVVDLAKECYRQGCETKTIELPRITKGVDDFFFKYGEDADKMFQELRDQARDPLDGMFYSFDDIKQNIHQEDLGFSLNYGALPEKLQAFYEWVTDSTHAPDELNVAAFIGVCAASIGKQAKIKGPGGKYMAPCLWTCGIAPSGRGKTTAFNISLDFLQEINLENHELRNEFKKIHKKALRDYEKDETGKAEEPGEIPKIRVPILPMITSQEKFYESLALGDGSGVIASSEELSVLAADLNKDRNQGFKQFLMSLQGGSKAAIQMDFKNSTDLPLIKEPAVSILGCSVMSSFLSTFRAVDFYSGFLQRFHFVIGSKKPSLAMPPEKCKIKESEFKKIVNDLFYMNNKEPSLHQLSSEALEYWKANYHGLDSEFGFISNDAIISAFDRYNNELTFQIALIFHYLKNQNSLDISKGTLKQAIQYVKYLKHSLIYVLKQYQSSERISFANKLVDKLVTHTQNGLSMKKLKDRCAAHRSNNQIKFENSIDFLLDEGIIEIKQVPNGSNNESFTELVYLMLQNTSA